MPIPERRCTLALLAVLALLCLSMLPPGAPLVALVPPVVHAATLAVTSPGDSGAGSLRQAIIDAANGDTITFDLPANATITLASQIDVTTTLTIDGAGVPGLTISGNNANRVFQIGAAVTLANMTLANGLSAASNDGGAVYVFTSSPLTLTDVVVRDSIASDDGGGVYAGGPLTVRGGRFENNRTSGASQNNGGGVYAAGTSSISGTQVISNTGNEGGGIFAGGHATLTNTNFISNTAFAGGGIGNSSLGSSATVVGGRFERNQAFLTGGAIFIYTLALTNTDVISNTAPQGGGIFTFQGQMSNVQLERNTADVGGGALIRGTAAITSSSFISNTADVGGGVLIQGTAAITSSSFISNTSVVGGGGAYIDGTAAITSSSFLSNTAENGGGAYVGGTVAITSSSFLSNTAQIGGGLYIVNSSGSTIRASHLLDNFAMDGGGALYLVKAKTTLENNFVGGNTSQNGATAIEFGGVTNPSSFTAMHNTFVAVSPGHGVAINAGDSSTITLTNTIFADYAVALQAGSKPATITSDGVLFSNVTTPTETLTTTASITVTNAITGTAAFVDAAARNYHLTGASAAINAGVASSVTIDIDGQTRTIGSAPDLGADEFSNTPPTISTITNQTTTVDTLVGPLPFTVGDADGDTLMVTASSSNTTLVPNASIVLGGSGADRTVTITPAAGQTGTATITLTVSDGTATASTTFTLTVTKSGTIGIEIYLPLVQR